MGQCNTGSIPCRKEYCRAKRTWLEQTIGPPDRTSMTERWSGALPWKLFLRDGEVDNKLAFGRKKPLPIDLHEACALFLVEL